MPTFQSDDIAPPPPAMNREEKRSKDAADGVIYYAPPAPPPSIFEYIDSHKDGGDVDSAAQSISTRSGTPSSAAGSSIVASHTKWSDMPLGLTHPASAGGSSGAAAIGVDHIFCSRGGTVASGEVQSASLDILALPCANWGPNSGPALPMSNILPGDHFNGAVVEMQELDLVESEYLPQFVDCEMYPEFAVSRTWFRRIGQIALMEVTPHCNARHSPETTTIGHPCTLAEEQRFMDNAENGLQFRPNIKESQGIRGGVIVLSGNPGSAPPSACEHSDEFLTRTDTPSWLLSFTCSLLHATGIRLKGVSSLLVPTMQMMQDFCLATIIASSNLFHIVDLCGRQLSFPFAWLLVCCAVASMVSAMLTSIHLPISMKQPAFGWLDHLETRFRQLSEKLVC